MCTVIDMYYIPEQVVHCQEPQDNIKVGHNRTIEIVTSYNHVATEADRNQLMKY